MKPRFTARSFQLYWLLILMLLDLALSACASVRSTVATMEPGIRLTLTMANAPGSQLTQTAQRIPTRYVTITPTPRPPTPSPKPTATPVWTVTPILASSSKAAWAVEAVEVKGWPADSHMQFLSWDSNASVGVDGYFMVDVVSAVVVTPIPASTPTTFRSIPEDNLTLSRDGFYAIECADDGLRLYHIASNSLLSQTNVHAGWCESVDWSEDSSVASVVSDDGRVYVWPVDGSPPNEVGHAMPFSAARWSPDSKRLVLVNFSSVGADWASFSIIYRDGKPALDKGADFEAGNGWEPTFVGWLTNDIVTNYRQCGFMCNYVEYYDADTGRYLTTQMDSFTQTASRSPDKLWLVLDRSNYGERNFYEFFDLQEKKTYSLADGQNEYLEFSGWSNDSLIFYLVSQPVTETAASSPQTPFGLLALNPVTRQFTQLFEQAVFAKFSPDKSLAWVVFPSKRADGTLGLDSGIFNLADGTLTERQFVSDRIIYANPAEGDLVPAAWSNDGTRLVFGDSQGNLTLVRTDGTSQSLAANLPHDDVWPAQVHYAWSPDDRHLLVQCGDRAWIVSMPTP